MSERNIVPMIYEKIHALPRDIPRYRAENIEVLSPAGSHSEHLVLAGTDTAGQDYRAVKEHGVCPQAELWLPFFPAFCRQMGFYAVEIVTDQKTGLLEVQFVSGNG